MIKTDKRYWIEALHYCITTVYYKICVKIFWKFKRSPIYGIIRDEKNIPYKADDALDQHNYTVDW